MARVDTSQFKTFPQITERLDAIVSQVRDKDVSLEKSLDLFDEAIALGSKAVDMVDATDFSPEEAASLEAEAAGKSAKAEGEAAAGPDSSAATEYDSGETSAAGQGDN